MNFFNHRKSIENSSMSDIKLFKRDSDYLLRFLIRNGIFGRKITTKNGDTISVSRRNDDWGDYDHQFFISISPHDSDTYFNLTYEDKLFLNSKLTKVGLIAEYGDQIPRKLLILERLRRIINNIEDGEFNYG